MKKIIISLTFIIGSLSQAVFGVMVPYHANLASCASPSFLASAPTTSTVNLCTTNQTHAKVVTQDGIYSAPLPLTTTSSVDISPSIIQNFFYANGINMAHEQARFSEAPTVDVPQLHLFIDRMANTFKKLQRPATGTFGFLIKMYRALKKCALEEYFEVLAKKMQHEALSLRFDISGIEGVQPVFLQKPKLHDFYAAMATLLNNVKTVISEKTKEYPANLFNFGIHIEQVDLTTATPSHQETPSEAHAFAWCEKEDRNCKHKCCGNGVCTQNAKTFACAMSTMSVQIMDNSLDQIHQVISYLHQTFTTIHQRSQLFAQTHHEFFHGYDGKNGMLFDVMTEVARRLELLDSTNPSPLLLRLSSTLFNLHARNVEHFLTQTWPRTPTDHDSLIKTLILSVNVALGGNFYSNGECTLKYWLDSISITDLNLKPLLASIVSMLGLTPQEANDLSEKIIAIYARYPALNIGHLLQLFVPQAQTDGLAYMSSPGGTPSDSKTPTTTVLAKYSDNIRRSFFAEDFRQARFILRPNANLLVYRYYRTPEAQAAEPKALAELQALLDNVVTQREGKIPRLAEQVRFGKTPAIQQAQEILSNPSTHITPATITLAHALLEQNIVHPLCLTILGKAVASPQDQASTLNAYELFKTFVATSSNLHLADPLTATGIDLIIQILQTSQNDALKDDALSLHIDKKIDTLPLDKQIIFASYGMLSKDKPSREGAFSSFKSLLSQNIKPAYHAAFTAAINAITNSHNADIEADGFDLLGTLFNDAHTLEHLEQQTFYTQLHAAAAQGIQSIGLNVRAKAKEILKVLRSRDYPDAYTTSFTSAINALTHSDNSEVIFDGLDLLINLFNDTNTLKHLPQQTLYSQSLKATVQHVKNGNIMTREKAIELLKLLKDQGFTDVYEATANAVINALTTSNHQAVIIDNFNLLIELINDEHTLEHVPQEALYAQALTAALANLKSIEYYRDQLSKKAKDVLNTLKKHGYADAYTKAFAFGYDAVMKSNIAEKEQVGLELLHDLLNDEHILEHLPQEALYPKTLEAVLRGFVSDNWQVSFKAYPILNTLFDKNYAPAFTSSLTAATTMIISNNHLNYALWVLSFLIKNPHTLSNIPPQDFYPAIIKALGRSLRIAQHQDDMSLSTLAQLLGQNELMRQATLNALMQSLASNDDDILSDALAILIELTDEWRAVRFIKFTPTDELYAQATAAVTKITVDLERHNVVAIKHTLLAAKKLLQKTQQPEARATLVRTLSTHQKHIETLHLQYGSWEEREAYNCFREILATEKIN